MRYETEGSAKLIMNYEKLVQVTGACSLDALHQACAVRFAHTKDLNQPFGKFDFFGTFGKCRFFRTFGKCRFSGTLKNKKVSRISADFFVCWYTNKYHLLIKTVPSNLSLPSSIII